MGQLNDRAALVTVTDATGNLGRVLCAADCVTAAARPVYGRS